VKFRVIGSVRVQQVLRVSAHYRINLAANDERRLE
jgi:hypothetical protein